MPKGWKRFLHTLDSISNYEKERQKKIDLNEASENTEYVKRVSFTNDKEHVYQEAHINLFILKGFRREQDKTTNARLTEIAHQLKVKPAKIIIDIS